VPPDDDGGLDVAPFADMVMAADWAVNGTEVVAAAKGPFQLELELELEFDVDDEDDDDEDVLAPVKAVTGANCHCCQACGPLPVAAPYIVFIPFPPAPFPFGPAPVAPFIGGNIVKSAVRPCGLVGF